MPEDNKNSKNNFDYKAFAKDLAMQAKELVPDDLSNDDKDFVVNTLYEFCMMAGDAVLKDENVNIDAQDAALLVQIIGEWTFNKGVDLIRGKIDSNLRKPVLEKVAFTIYEIAKHAISNKMPQDKMIELVEFHVRKSFKAAIDELVSKNIINSEIAQNTLSQSNIDAIVEQQMMEDKKRQEELDDNKKAKLASLAFLVRNFPEDKIKKIISKLTQAEAEVFIQYLKIKNLEAKFSPKVAVNYLKDMKKHLPKPAVISYERCYLELCKIVKNSEKNQIESIIKEERPKVVKYVMAAYENKREEIPPMIANVICRHLKEKLSI